MRRAASRATARSPPPLARFASAATHLRWVPGRLRDRAPKQPDALPLALLCCAKPELPSARAWRHQAFALSEPFAKKQR